MSAAPTTVLVVAPNWLGDAVMALPAVADVKRHFRDSKLVVIARGGVADLFHMAPVVDAVIRVTWRGGLFNPSALRKDTEQLQASGADVAILLPNSFASAWLVRRAGIAQRWGYATDVRGRLLSRAIPRPGGSRHQGAYYQHLVSALGIENGALAPQLLVGDDAREAARRLLTERGWNGASPLVTLAPGAAYGRAKQWLPSHVVRLAAMLTSEGKTCVFVGSGADKATTRQILSAMSSSAAAAAIDLAGSTSLAEVAAVLQLSSACVSNDSGAMHVAAAVGTPVVALFGPTSEGETSPLTVPGGWTRVLTAPAWCRPCMLRECPLDHRCMSGITPAMVATALGEIPSTSMRVGTEQ